MKRADEEFCKRCFNSYLISMIKDKRIRWEEEINDPPDYYLCLDDKKYAVEVTIITEIIKVDSKELSHAALINSVNKFLHEVEKLCLSEGILSGLYGFSYWGPFSNFRQTKEKIKKSIIDYVHRTREDKQAPEEPIIAYGDERCSIQKLQNKKQGIIKTLGPTFVKWEKEAQEVACKILQHAINDKVFKLRKINLPKILLLMNAYPFTFGRQTFKSCIPKISGANIFETIFIVERYDSGYVLFGKDLADISG